MEVICFTYRQKLDVYCWSELFIGVKVVMVGPSAACCYVQLTADTVKQWRILQ